MTSSAPASAKPVLTYEAVLADEIPRNKTIYIACERADGIVSWVVVRRGKTAAIEACKRHEVTHLR